MGPFYTLCLGARFGASDKIWRLGQNLAPRRPGSEISAQDAARKLPLEPGISPRRLEIVTKEGTHSRPASNLFPPWRQGGANSRRALTLMQGRERIQIQARGGLIRRFIPQLGRKDFAKNGEMTSYVPSQRPRQLSAVRPAKEHIISLTDCVFIPTAIHTIPSIHTHPSTHPSGYAHPVSWFKGVMGLSETLRGDSNERFPLPGDLVEKARKSLSLYELGKPLFDPDLKREGSV